MNGRNVLAGVAWPLLSGAIGLALWEGLVRAFDIPVFLLPAPTQVAATIVAQWSYLISQLAITVMAAGLGLIISVALGLALGAAIAGSRFVELPGAGHISNMDRPAEFNRALRDFLSA